MPTETWWTDWDPTDAITTSTATPPPPPRQRNGYRLSFGRHDGKLLERVIMTHPAYVDWLLRAPGFKGKAVVDHIHTCLDAADRKTIQRRCYGDQCTNPASMFSIHLDNAKLMSFRCNACGPQFQHCNTTVIRSTQQLFDEVLRGGWQAPKTALAELLGTLMDAKGLERPQTDDRLVAFFGR